jgi:hypothetical protein
VGARERPEKFRGDAARPNRDGKKALGLFDSAVRRSAPKGAAQAALVTLLKGKDGYQGGHGHAGTSQLAIPMRIGGRIVSKPRLWLFDYEQFKKLEKV